MHSGASKSKCWKLHIQNPSRSVLTKLLPLLTSEMTPSRHEICLGSPHAYTEASRQHTRLFLRDRRVKLSKMYAIPVFFGLIATLPCRQSRMGPNYCLSHGNANVQVPLHSSSPSYFLQTSIGQCSTHN